MTRMLVSGLSNRVVAMTSLPASKHMEAMIRVLMVEVQVLLVRVSSLSIPAIVRHNMVGLYCSFPVSSKIEC